MTSVKEYIYGIYTKASSIHTILYDSLSTLKAILAQLGGDPDEPPEPIIPIISNFPREGKRLISAEGILIIDTRTGIAILPDESIEHLSAPIPNESCNSILIDANAQIDLTLLEGDKTSLASTIYPAKIRLHNIPFNAIKIKTTTATTLQIFISNVESPTIEDIASSTNKRAITVNSQTVPSHGTAVALPSIVVPDGYRLVVRADPDNTDNIYVGGTSAEAEAHTFTLAPDEVLTYGVMNANAIYIDAAVDDEGVELTVEQD